MRIGGSSRHSTRTTGDPGPRPRRGPGSHKHWCVCVCVCVCRDTRHGQRGPTRDVGHRYRRSSLSSDVGHRYRRSSLQCLQHDTRDVTDTLEYPQLEHFQYLYFSSISNTSPCDRGGSSRHSTRTTGAYGHSSVTWRGAVVARGIGDIDRGEAPGVGLAAVYSGLGEPSSGGGTWRGAGGGGRRPTRASRRLGPESRRGRPS